MWHPDARRIDKFKSPFPITIFRFMSYEMKYGQEERKRGSSRSVWPAMWTGSKCRCPRCGEGKLYASYLKVKDECDSCGLALHHHRADDAPPYFTMFIVGHLLVPLVFWVERSWQPELWVHALLWLPFALIMSLLLLPMVKGAIVGLQWANGMHGFGLTDEESKWVRPETLEQDSRAL